MTYSNHVISLPECFFFLFGNENSKSLVIVSFLHFTDVVWVENI